MKSVNCQKRKWFHVGVGFALFAILALQAPMLSYGMESMDCGSKIMCAACGGVVNSVPSSLSSYFTELAPLPEPLTPKPIFIPESLVNPPQ